MLLKNIRKEIAKVSGNYYNSINKVYDMKKSIEQAEIIKRREGFCALEWDCSECAILQTIQSCYDSSSCFPSLAFKAAIAILENETIGMCKSIWEN